MISKLQKTKALISLRGCAGWSAPFLFSNPQRQVFSRRGPYSTVQSLLTHLVITWIGNNTVMLWLPIYYMEFYKEIKENNKFIDFLTTIPGSHVFSLFFFCIIGRKSCINKEANHKFWKMNYDYIQRHDSILICIGRIIWSSTWKNLSFEVCVRADLSAPLLFTFWKVSYLDLLQVKFQFSS